MPARLSIIIPTLNSAAELVATLDRLREGHDCGLISEIIISDGGSDDDTISRAKDAGARLVTGGTGRGGQLRTGAAQAQTAWLMFLHSDTHLEPGWSHAVQNHITCFPDQAACFRLGFQANGALPRMVASWANIRTRLFGLPYGDQGLLVARSLYDQVGGFQDIPLMEDVAIARALRGKIKLMRCRALTNPDKFQRNGWIRQGTRNFVTLAQYFLGVSPDRLARRYARQDHPLN